MRKEGQLLRVLALYSGTDHDYLQRCYCLEAVSVCWGVLLGHWSSIKQAKSFAVTSVPMAPRKTG